MICPQGKQKVFHITGPEGAALIKKDGLKASCRLNIPFADIFSEKRRCSNYGWADLLNVVDEILDEHPIEKPGMVAEICVDENTPVYNMLKINEAEECVSAQEPPHPHFRHLSQEDMVKCLKRHVCEWKASAIPLKTYPTRLYSHPEVLFGNVSPSEANVIPMVEAPIPEAKRELLKKFIENVDELQRTVTPEQREKWVEGSKRFEEDWEQLYKERREKLKDIPHSKDIECTKEIMDWDWFRAARDYLKQAGIEPKW